MAPVMLAPHFSLGELGGSAAPLTVVEALRTTAEGLEMFRELVGAPFKITSGWRDWVPGQSPTSDHPKGLAADGYFVGLSMYEAYKRIRDNAMHVPVDQIIYYPYTTGHIHFGFGPRFRGQWLVKLAEKNSAGKEYELVSTKHLQHFPGFNGAL